jgi:arylformamidase
VPTTRCPVRAALSAAVPARYTPLLMRILDISQPLGSTTAVWPGDQVVSTSWTMRRDRGDSVNVAALLTSVHAGTHADGFLHVSDGGEVAAAMPLDPYIGRCLVVDATGRDVVDEDVVADIDLRHAQRLLFRTRVDGDATSFPARVAALDPALVRRLGEAGVRLVGTDTPSVDPLDSKTLDAHHACIAGRVAILENLVLEGVAAGEYTLVALPLRLVEADSSPVRAVLLPAGALAGDA